VDNRLSPLRNRLYAGPILILLGSALHPSPIPAQESGPHVPNIIFRFDPAYQAVVAHDGDAEDDARWAERRARDLTDFYKSEGARLLRLISDYAGLSWPYGEIDVYVVRDFPTLSIQYPFTLAVGSIRQEGSHQDVPSGDFLILTFAHQVTHYLLDPPPEALEADRPASLDHPLMEDGNYRREALVNLLASRALRDLWGEPRLRKVLDEPLWASYNPEEAFVDSLQNVWPLSASRPLLSWLESEPKDGRLVELARRLESSRGGREDGTPSDQATPAAPGRLSGSEFGFDLGQTSEGRLFIAFLDHGSPADRAGLRSGDLVQTVEGRPFDSPADAMRAVRSAWDSNREINLSVDRQGREVFFQVH
jgi:hypothetical protein